MEKDTEKNIAKNNRDCGKKQWEKMYSGKKDSGKTIFSVKKKQIVNKNRQQKKYRVSGKKLIVKKNIYSFSGKKYRKKQFKKNR